MPLRLRSLPGFAGHHAQWLGVWMVLGAVLRFTNLSEKPPWTDEFATFVFSLGRSFRTVPLNQVISLETLLLPVLTHPVTGVEAVVQSLFQESNHPPLYFVLTHFWLRLWPSGDPWISVGVARALAALVGVLLIPILFGLGWLAVRSWRVAHLAALLMALSPFAIYLSQEARHYTLPMVWISGALACLLATVRSLQRQQRMSWGLVLGWVAVHGLALATHYFGVLAIGAEAIALGVVALWGRSRISRQTWRLNGIRLTGVALGTLATGVVWLPLFLASQQDAQTRELTQWILVGDRRDWLAPLGQLLAGLITQLYLLPVQAAQPAVVILSGVGMVVLTLFTLPLLWRGWRAWASLPETQGAVVTLAGFVGGAIALMLGITYGAGVDLTSAFRYNFVYFPGTILLIALGLAGLGAPPVPELSNPSESQKFPMHSQARSLTTLVLVFYFIGGLTVLVNLGYQKTHRPDRVVQTLTAVAQADPATPHLVAIAHRTHGQTGRLMAIAWDWQQRFPNGQTPDPAFLLLHQTTPPRAAVNTLEVLLAQQPAPFYLWLINTQQLPRRPLDAALAKNCQPHTEQQSVDGYEYQAYRCINSNT